ncbi:MAG: dihydroorotate dehydrogenase (quinone) [Elusimicrobia bacterium RBG_16_66_12]|nr:MAG: dihydroorotate dehydrogenase (quinone) [Elusimicrobia bacterium RBG_16_66_12]
MYARLRPLLFRVDAEQAHRATLWLLEALSRVALGRRVIRQISGSPRTQTHVEVIGLSFPNRLGLAAGYDKDGRALRGLASLGFGHLEIGTITPLAQGGNPRPRLFRLVEEEALINRLGFPNAGGESVRDRLRARRTPGVVLGVNIGKGKETPLESAPGDYGRLLLALGPWADYVAINVSSPNTLGLRSLQGRVYLEGLLAELVTLRARLDRRLPMLVKLSPDLTEAGLDEAVDVIESAGVEGVIATNTTLAREGVESPLGSEAGGLSGKPLFRRALAAVERIVRRTQGRLPVIAVGGIRGGKEARAMREAGAALVQVYTGLVYRGPALVGEILEALG